ncbi:MAG: trypsin-like peptidase domain-containing protein, partial [Bdellovibrionales bacterium]|nr:trypsin-like peptidase domain-containing protein [Bdellovibrionales bacterium]
MIKKVITSLFLIYSISTFGKTLEPIKGGQPLPVDRLIKLAELVNPAVVNISTAQLPKAPQMDPRMQDPFFEFFAPFMGPVQRRPAQSLGTGFIIRSDGLIITNNHVIDNADVIKVQLTENDSESYEAEVIGKDARTDIALIKISGKKEFPIVELGTSSTLKVGEWVAAFGNPFGHGHSMTKGIISAIGREIGELNRF